jgi:glyoxylase-like metal-dependent hydrolase (beta-lactamase superfamily II)
MREKWAYTKGLHDLGDGAFAYLLPDGSWGWSNAGLIVGEGRSMLVDTLFDLRLTREMLDSMRGVTTGRPIETLVNTHANGDHCYGNQLVSDAEIIASRAAALEMEELPPAALAAFMKADLGPELNEYMRACFGSFEFEGIEPTPPTKTFEKRLDVGIGGRKVELIEVGPAHTAGDVLVHVPDARTLFTGDILFIGGTPIIWAGPVSNWIAACDLMLRMDLEKIVPGHGPVSDARGVEQVKRYLEFVHAECRKRFDAGMSAEQAAFDIELGEFADWGDSERIAVNVDSIYRELDSSHPPANPVELFGRMAKLARR